MQTKTLTIDELHQQSKALGANDLILDVRTAAEFAEGHVPGSKNISVDVVMNHANELKNYKTIYVYCRAGRRAQTACEILSALGFQNLACVDEGGFPNWEASQYPVEK